MDRELERPDPELLLAQIQSQEEPIRGRLRIWLGAAVGAGKTSAMLREGHRRKDRGSDVVIGFIESHGRPHIDEQRQGLETVPPLQVSGAETAGYEMDTVAILARHPKVALVDDLAHANATGFKNAKRYQDVAELLDAGISVITTLNVENIESLSEYIQQVTGITVSETVPDAVLDLAEQVELIDLPPEAFIQRMNDGEIYPPEQARRALDTYYTIGNLTALRALALHATAREVEEKLDRYFHQRGVDGFAVGERIMVAVDHRPSGQTLIRRGWRLAAAVKGELIAVHIEPIEARRRTEKPEDERRLQANLQLAENLGAELVHLEGKVSDELITFARMHHVSHLFIGHPSHRRWEEFLHGSVTGDILRKAPDISVHIIGDADVPG